MPTSGTYRHFSPKRWECAHVGLQPLGCHHQWSGLPHMAQRKQLPHSAQWCMISRTRISARVLRSAGRHGAKFEIMFLAILKPETEIMRETPWSRIRGQQREQRTPGDCWQWKANAQCSKGENCSFRVAKGPKRMVTKVQWLC